MHAHKILCKHLIRKYTSKTARCLLFKSFAIVGSSWALMVHIICPTLTNGQNIGDYGSIITFYGTPKRMVKFVQICPMLLCLGVQLFLKIVLQTIWFDSWYSRLILICKQSEEKRIALVTWVSNV